MFAAKKNLCRQSAGEMGMNMMNIQAEFFHSNPLLWLEIYHDLSPNPL